MDGEIEQPLQEHPSPTLSIEVGENPPPDLWKPESDRVKTFYQTVLSVIVVFIVAAFSGYNDVKPLYSTTGHKEAHLSNLLVADTFFTIVTFLSAVVLMMFEFFVRHSQRCRRTCRIVIILVGVTGMMLTVADTVLVVIVNRNNALLSAVLAPVLVLVVVTARVGARLMEQEQASSELGTRYETAMKATFDMATTGTMASFALQGTVVFGYLKGAEGKQEGRDPPLDLAMCYLTSTLCLSAMMICAMPLSLLPGSMLENLASYAERLKQAVLAALAMMTLVVAVEFLDGLAVLSLCPEAIAFVLYGAMEFFSEREHRGENLPFLDFIYRTVAAVAFTLMTGLYAAFLGTDHYSVYLKAAMFVLLLAVLSSLSRLAISFQVPETRGAIQIGVLGFPAAALMAACPLIFKVVLDLYQNR